MVTGGKVVVTGDEAVGTGDHVAVTGDEVVGTGDQTLVTGDEMLATGDEMLVTGGQVLGTGENDPSERAHAGPKGLPEGCCMRGGSGAGGERRRPDRAGT